MNYKAELSNARKALVSSNKTATLKIGDRVLWSANWATSPPVEVVVEGIELVTSGNKYGEKSEDIFWSDVEDHAVLDLANGKWCYGSAVAPAPSENQGFYLALHFEYWHNNPPAPFNPPPAVTLDTEAIHEAMRLAGWTTPGHDYHCEFMRRCKLMKEALEVR